MFSKININYINYLSLTKREQNQNISIIFRIKWEVSSVYKTQKEI